MTRNKQQPAFLTRLKERQIASVTPPKRSRLHRLADWLNDWHLTRIFQAASAFLLFLTLFAFYIELMDRERARTVSAWQLLTTKATGNSGKIEALEYLNSIGTPLEGIDLSVDPDSISAGVFLEGVVLQGAVLNSSTFHKARLFNANLKNTNLIHADMILANLVDADLSHSDLAFSHIESSRVIRANLEHSDLTGANLHFSDLTEANFTGAILQGADLDTTLFMHATLANTNLSHANLRRANLLNANLEGAILDYADLTETHLTGVTGLSCNVLTKARNWEKSYRPPELACGKEIPDMQDYEPEYVRRPRE